MMKWLLALVIFLAGAGAVHADSAPSARGLEGYARAHGYVPVALSFEGANRQSVAAWVNGRKLRLLVDTGSRHTCLTAACARSLGLDVHDTGQPLIGMGGLAGGNEGIAPVCSFTLRYGEASRAGTVTVLPGSVGLGEHDGILGLDVLAGGAAIYPVSGAALLVRAGTAPPVAIAELMTRLGFRAAPVTLARGRLWIDGHILGRAMQFVVDTGAYFSDFNAESVRAAGGPLAPAMLPLTGVDGRRQTSYGFMARAMDLGGVALAPEPLLATRSVAFRTLPSDGVVGSDLLGEHRAVIDLGGGTLWLK